MTIKRNVYVVVGNREGRDLHAHAAMNLLANKLIDLGFEVDVKNPTNSGMPKYEPVGVMLMEHVLAVPLHGMDVDPSVIPDRTVKVHPAVPTTMMSHNHPLQISVIGNIHVGKTALMSAFSNWLDVENPLALSIDHPDLPSLLDMSTVNDILPRIKDQIVIHMRQYTVATRNNLFDLFDANPLQGVPSALSRHAAVDTKPTSSQGESVHEHVERPGDAFDQFAALMRVKSNEMGPLPKNHEELMNRFADTLMCAGNEDQFIEIAVLAMALQNTDDFTIGQLIAAGNDDEPDDGPSFNDIGEDFTPTKE